MTNAYARRGGSHPPLLAPVTPYGPVTKAPRIPRTLQPSLTGSMARSPEVS